MSHVFENGECTICKEADPDYVPDIEEPSEYTVGDINGDGAINGKDSNLLKQILSGAVAVTEEMIAVCDMHKDGSINGMDANLLARYIAGEIAGF